MDIKKFVTYTTIGSFQWCLALAYIGFSLGPHWQDVERLFRYLDIVVIVGFVALVVYVIYHRKR
ncbi:MAG: DedA family protein, partial [Halobacteriota archaeon]